MKDLIKRIIKEGILSKQRGIIPDMAGRITSAGLKKSDYVESGKLNLREELKKLVVKFIYINYGKEELENYKGKLTKFVYGLSDEDLTTYDSIFLKAVNNKDEESIVLANEFLDNVKSGNIDFQGVARRRQMNKKTYIDTERQRERQKVLPNKELEELKRQYVKARNGIQLGEEILTMDTSSGKNIKFDSIWYYIYKNYNYTPSNKYNYNNNPYLLKDAIKYGLIDEESYTNEINSLSNKRDFVLIIRIFKKNVKEGLDRLKMKLGNLKELMYNKYGYIPKS